jgi:hypothetical protein
MMRQETFSVDLIFRLEAIEAIRLLKARYFRFVDQKRWAELRELFTPDATLHFTELTAEPKPLDKALRHMAAALGPQVVSVHHGHMPELEILDETRAKGIWAMEDRIYLPQSPPNPLGLRRLFGFGHYHETYLRSAGEWRIQTLRLDRLHVEKEAADREVG